MHTAWDWCDRIAYQLSLSKVFHREKQTNTQTWLLLLGTRVSV